IPPTPTTTPLSYTTLFRSPMLTPDCRRQPIQPGGVQAENLPFGRFCQLRVAPFFSQPLGDLEPPQCFDLPLWAPVPERVRAKDRSEEHTSELQSLAYLVCR